LFFFGKTCAEKESSTVTNDAQSDCTIVPSLKSNENETADEPSPSKKFKPSTFQNSWKKDRPWLDVNEKREMICNYCIDNKMTNTFTTGCTYFRTSTLTRHVATTDHKLSVFAKTESKSLEKTVQNVVSQQEGAVKSAIDTVYWLAKEKLPQKNILLC
jgi:hypothetical protein